MKLGCDNPESWVPLHLLRLRDPIALAESRGRSTSVVAAVWDGERSLGDDAALQSVHDGGVYVSVATDDIGSDEFTPVSSPGAAASLRVCWSSSALCGCGTAPASRRGECRCTEHRETAGHGQKSVHVPPRDVTYITACLLGDDTVLPGLVMTADVGEK